MVKLGKGQIYPATGDYLICVYILYCLYLIYLSVSVLNKMSLNKVTQLIQVLQYILAHTHRFFNTPQLIHSGSPVQSCMHTQIF